MDVQMPIMDGMEATRLIRSGDVDGVNPHVPIIGLSAYAMREYRERFIQAGMNAFVSKPVNFKSLFQTIDEVHNNPVDHAPKEKPAPAPPEPQAIPKEQSLVDIEGITDHYANKSEMFSRLCTMFFESVRDNMDKLKGAAQMGNMAGVEKLAHSIRGSAASMGAQALSEAAARLENVAGNNNADIAQKLQRLESILEPSLAQMDELRKRFKS
jgi:CheY-like chemotaxis protein